eukprot:12712978-Prorocentrum_lima.AAC.1
MTSSLVGSEMCIRDSLLGLCQTNHLAEVSCRRGINGRDDDHAPLPFCGCLLYTSDAADDM